MIFRVLGFFPRLGLSERHRAGQPIVSGRRKASSRLTWGRLPTRAARQAPASRFREPPHIVCARCWRRPGSHNTPLRAPRTPNRAPPPAHSRRPRRAAPGPRPPAAAPPPPSAAAWAATGTRGFFFPPRRGVNSMRGGEWNLPAAFTLAQTVSKQDGPIGGTRGFFSLFFFFFLS